IAHTGFPCPVLRGLEGLEDGEVDALDHRGQHGAGLNVVLVGVDPDRELPLVLGRLEHAEPGGSGGGVDDVGAAVELAPGQLAAPRRVVPRGRRRARHVLEDLDLRIDEPGALLVAESELADQRDVHAPDEPDLARLRGHGRRHPDEERALVLLEHDRLDIGQIHDRVDDGELDGGELLGHLLHAAGLGEADAHDDLRATPRHVAQRLLALGLRGDLELAIRDARLLLEALGPVVGPFVEGLVELAAHVEHDGRGELLGGGAAGHGREGEREDGSDESPRVGHGGTSSVRDDTRGPLSGVARFGYAVASFMSGKPRIYIAGPLGFSEAGRHFYTSVLIPFVNRLGYDVADPWTLTDARKIEAVQAMPQGPDRRDAWRRLNEEIGANNRAAIDGAQGLVAILDGTDVDSGTAA